MARITDIYPVETPAQPAVAIRSTVRADRIPAAIASAFAQLEDYLKAGCAAAANTPFLQISGDDPQSVDITAGIETSRRLEGSGGIQVHTVPAGKKLVCYWLGDNAGMSSLYAEMRQVALQMGRVPPHGVYEYYLNGPEYGPDRLLTRVVMPLD